MIPRFAKVRHLLICKAIGIPTDTQPLCRMETSDCQGLPVRSSNVMNCNGTRPGAVLSCSSSSASLIGWLGFEDEDEVEREDELVHGPNAFGKANRGSPWTSPSPALPPSPRLRRTGAGPLNSFRTLATSRAPVRLPPPPSSPR